MSYNTNITFEKTSCNYEADGAYISGASLILDTSYSRQWYARIRSGEYELYPNGLEIIPEAGKSYTKYMALYLENTAGDNRKILWLSDDYTTENIGFIARGYAYIGNTEAATYSYNSNWYEQNYILDADDYSSYHLVAAIYKSSVPIFESYSDAYDYVTTGIGIKKALNYDNKNYEDMTKDYFISNERGDANCVRNSATPTGTVTWRSMRFLANSEPVLYYNDNDYSLTLIANDVVASKSLSGPLSVIDNVPQSSWTEGALEYTGLFYGNIPSRMQARGDVLPDGAYMYGFTLSTNIPIFKDLADAEEAIETEDYSKAVNYPQISTGGTYNPPEFGVDETSTIFGDGGVSAPMSSQYIISEQNLRAVANTLFSTTTSVIDAVLDGLKMYGANPLDVIGGLSVYPFSVSALVNSSPQTYIYFGSYQMTGVNVDKIVNYKNAYLDAGTIFLASLQHSYRDFSPYTQLSVYLPYIGWQKLDIAKYIDKTVNIRYYVDLHTGSCIAVLLANNVMVDYFTGQIASQLPVSGTDLRAYSSAVINTVLGGAGGVVSTGANAASMAGAIGGSFTGAAGAAGIGGALGSAAGPIGVVAGAAIGVGIQTASTLFQLEKLGLPKDHAITKGNFTGQLGMSMPQYVLFRYDIFDGVEPDMFNEMCGRPSNASGYVSSFSGFLSCKSASLNTSGMLDSEVSAITSLLKGGIFV